MFIKFRIALALFAISLLVGCKHNVKSYVSLDGPYPVYVTKEIRGRTLECNTVWPYNEKEFVWDNMPLKESPYFADLRISVRRNSLALPYDMNREKLFFGDRPFLSSFTHDVALITAKSSTHNEIESFNQTITVGQSMILSDVTPYDDGIKMCVAIKSDVLDDFVYRNIGNQQLFSEPKLKRYLLNESIIITDEPTVISIEEQGVVLVFELLDVGSRP